MNNSSLMLAFETCTTGCSVAIGNAEGVIASLTDERHNHQARELLPMIETALKRAGATYADLNGLTTTTGPGSFTGIRVGLAAARAIVLAHPMSAIGVNTLEAIAWRALQQPMLVNRQTIVSLWNASKGQAYMQRFEWSKQHLIALTPPSLIAIDAIASILDRSNECIVGNVATDQVTAPHAEGLLLRCRTEGIIPSPDHALTPLYIRDADAKLPQQILFNQ